MPNKYNTYRCHRHCSSHTWINCCARWKEKINDGNLSRRDGQMIMKWNLCVNVAHSLSGLNVKRAAGKTEARIAPIQLYQWNITSASHSNSDNWFGTSIRNTICPSANVQFWSNSRPSLRYNTHSRDRAKCEKKWASEARFFLPWKN